MCGARLSAGHIAVDLPVHVLLLGKFVLTVHIHVKFDNFVYCVRPGGRHVGGGSAGGCAAPGRCCPQLQHLSRNLMNVCVVCDQVDGMLVVDLLVDVLLLADVVLNFHTGYIEEQVPESAVTHRTVNGGVGIRCVCVCVCVCVCARAHVCVCVCTCMHKVAPLFLYFFFLVFSLAVFPNYVLLLRLLGLYRPIREFSSLFPTQLVCVWGGEGEEGRGFSVWRFPYRFTVGCRLSRL
jgi:hypothetical protein